MDKGRKIISVSMTTRAHEALAHYCEEHQTNRSRLIELAVLKYIYEQLLQEVENNGQENNKF